MGASDQGDQASVGSKAAATGAKAKKVKAGSEAISPELAAAGTEPVKRSGTWEQVKALVAYMSRTEVHTYAFSVAAQAILSLFPFIVLLLTLSQRVFHSTKMVDVVSEMMTNFLPNNQEFVMRNMRLLVASHAKAKVVSVVMLLITTTGVFLPLEVALNSVWGVKKNRSYLRNQMVSVGLAAGVALLAMASVAFSTAQQTVLEWIFFGHTNNLLFGLVGKAFLQIVAFVASVALFFLIYWGLPNRRVPARAVLPTAVVTGVLWTAAKYLYILVLPHLDFRAVYGPFEVSVGLMMWAFVTGLLLLAGAYVSATRQALREAREAEREG
ncbi:MAG TPA: YihY/virulence factor BrkB family protein [Acidobacteriaceae bacterium]|jgi:YihY family inner membrane protein|nr:YihY/virulence factor BrkB family protein [Acidobacteriaceae bacterium]